jgi:hypothetical protein
MKTFAFFWSLEGRRMVAYKSKTLEDAKALFRKDFPQHAKYMGEVYVEMTT